MGDVRIVGLLAFAACYAPHVTPGVPCTGEGPCPSGLSCIAGQCVVPGTAFGDARGDTATARPDSPAMPDAPPADAPLADAWPDGLPDGALPAIRIDIAGPKYTGIDYAGVWAADPGVGGICDGAEFDATTSTVNGTHDSTLFIHQMYGATLTCHVPNVAPGTYAVHLLFAELRLGPPPCTATSPTARIFDISLEGTTVATSFNMTETGGGCALAGGPGHAYDESYTLPITDGTLDVVETASQGAAALNAIELVPQ